MWYDERGRGEPLVMLHPGGVDSSALLPNVKTLASRFHVFLPERRGHGHTPDTDGQYSYELMADDLIEFIEQVVGGPAKIMGCSDGAVVGLLTAQKRPDLVLRLICAAGVYHNKGWHEGVIDLNATQGGKTVEEKLRKMHADGPKLGESDLKKIQCRTLVMIGDDDEVRLEHAISFYRALPFGELAIVPETSHGLLVEKPDLCNKIMLDFMTLEPVQTFAPIRRAQRK